MTDHRYDDVRFWHKTSTADVCSHVGDWKTNGHAAEGLGGVGARWGMAFGGDAWH
jgi:hypothetical protein